ncbi:hypothetical protein CHS0354_020041 [Potamilus streckersoni]|uniref:peptidylglycine monooxygenase n=1 Tax=Potamilus streckersoni TaxID=2493646 RepID=A0AAE0S8N7_9BIVA|nr:hypothetical protein CHS0354_020041 [Potamilus streckersoni]
METFLQKLSFMVFILEIVEICYCNPVQWTKWNDDPNYFTQTIRMPDAVSPEADALICHVVKLAPREAYILKYEPHATKQVAHHMMVYGCLEVGSEEPYWECGEMDEKSDHSVCKVGSRNIVWAWAMDASSRELPEGVGYRVGGTTDIKYLVLQLHYKDKFEPGQTDRSGVTLHMTYTPQPKQAGYYVLGNTGYIPPMTEEFYMESACTFASKDPIYPIGYRTHSHNLGVVTSGYRIRNGVWTEIGRMSPQLPETFYNVTTPGISIEINDVLAARCTMSSQRKTVTMIGTTNRDEMCNFYILFYTWKKENLKNDYCFRDAQQFHWSNYLNNIPITASSIQGLPFFERDDPFAEPSQSSSSERDVDTFM